MLCFHVDRGQVLVSRQTGQVRPSTHTDGKPVNQELCSLPDFTAKLPFQICGGRRIMVAARSQEEGWDEENRFAATAGFGVCSRSCRCPRRELQLRPRHGFL